MKTFAVTVRLRNNLLLERREGLGLSQAEVAESAGVNKHTYGALEALRIKPWRTLAPRTCIFDGCRSRSVPRFSGACVAHGGDPEACKEQRREWKRTATVCWTPGARAVATFYGVEPHELWPEAVAAIREPVVTRRMDAEEILEIAGGDTPDQVLEADEQRHGLALALATLRPRERDILSRHFGLDGRGGADFAAIAREEGRSRECIRKLAAKGLRMLRHPSRTRLIETHRAVGAGSRG